MSLRAEQLIGWNPAVVEQHVARVAGAHAELVFLLAGREARRPFFHDERRNAFGAGRAIGDGDDDEDIPDAAVRGEGLRAVQHPASARARRRRPHRRGVAARGRLGQAPRADLLAAGERHEVCVLLLLGAEQEDVSRAESVVRGDRERDARIDARELFDTDAVVDR